MFHYGKLNDASTITEIVQSETRINDGVHVFLSAEDNFTGESYIGRKWARPSLPWKTITRRQAKQQLAIDGILTQVQPAIDNIADDLERTLVQIYWDDATVFERNNSELISLASELGLTDEQVDDMFINAAKL